METHFLLEDKESIFGSKYLLYTQGPENLILISSALSRAFLPEHFFITIFFIVHPVQPWSALYSSSLQIHLNI